MRDTGSGDKNLGGHALRLRHRLRHRTPPPTSSTPPAPPSPPTTHSPVSTTRSHRFRRARRPSPNSPNTTGSPLLAHRAVGGRNLGHPWRPHHALSAPSRRPTPPQRRDSSAADAPGARPLDDSTSTATDKAPPAANTAPVAAAFTAAKCPRYDATPTPSTPTAVFADAPPLAAHTNVDTHGTPTAHSPTGYTHAIDATRSTPSEAHRANPGPARRRGRSLPSRRAPQLDHLSEDSDENHWSNAEVDFAAIDV